MDFLTELYWGNPLYMYFVSVLILVASFVAGMFVRKVAQGKLKAMAAKTETKIDDILAGMFETPLNVFVTIIGIYIGLAILSLPPDIEDIVEKGLMLVVTIFVVLSLSRLIDQVYDLIIMPRIEASDSKVDDQVAILVRKVLKVLLWVFSVLIILSNIGYNVMSLLTGLGLGGLAFAMAAKDTLANIFGGITIMLDRPFELGDAVTIKGVSGTVIEIGIRTTRLRTWDGHVVSIPNSGMADSVLENISARPSMKVTVPLGVNYATPPKQILEIPDMIKGVIKAQEGVDLDSEPRVHLLSFGASSLDFSIVYWIKDISNNFDIKHAINIGIIKVFADAGVDIPFTTYTIRQEK